MASLVHDSKFATGQLIYRLDHIEKIKKAHSLLCTKHISLQNPSYLSQEVVTEIRRQ